MTTLNIMIPDDVREKAAQVAHEENMSIDEFTTLALVQRLSTSVLDPYLEERAKRGNPQRFKEILAMVPDVPPAPEDRLE